VNTVVVIQARTNSSRLPGKVLLPVGGLPLTVLAARRAGNRGLPVVVATSTESSDDLLAETVKAHGIPCHRGSLESPLSRMVGALEDRDDNTAVVRLTADNVFPDGTLLAQLVEAFEASGAGYMCCSHLQSGLPYGVSAEVMRLGDMRQALASTDDPWDHEHVTPWIIRRTGVQHFRRYSERKLAHMRCTVDCLDDYLAVAPLFSAVDDPIEVDCHSLIDALAGQRYQPFVSQPVPRLVLGTVQLGLDYGITNAQGRPDQAQSEQLLKQAICNGVGWLDTARAYGDSEKVIGRALKDGWQGRAQIVTKLSPLVNCPADASAEVVGAFVDADIHASCNSLQVARLDVLMLHRFSHLTDWQGAAWQRLLQHRAEGRISALGASVQSPQELEAALDCEDIGFIQLPFNLFDWRWDDALVRLRAVRETRQLTVHVRSAYLQGLLLSDDPTLWRRAGVEDTTPVLSWLDQQCKALGCSRAELCLGYLNAMDWIDGVVVGMCSVEQLTENLNSFAAVSFTAQQLQALQQSRPQLSEQTLNPALWSAS